MITSTTDEELKGDNQDTPLESFNICKYAHQNEKSEYSMVSHSCKYADCFSRCTRESCVFEKDEHPALAHKFWVTCIFCRDKFSIDPKQMDVPICSRCRQIIANHLKLPFVCAHCGASVNEYTAMPFTRLCSDCLSKYVFNEACVHFELGEEVSTTPLDLP